MSSVMTPHWTGVEKSDLTLGGSRQPQSGGTLSAINEFQTASYPKRCNRETVGKLVSDESAAFAVQILFRADISEGFGTNFRGFQSTFRDDDELS